jgi:integrase/recombinase XerD
MDKTRHHNHSKTPGVVMRHLADEYLAGLEVRKYSPKSVAIYGRALQDFLLYLAQLGRERAQDITAPDLEAYRLALVHRNFAPSSLEVYLRAMRQWFAWLEQSQQLFANPAAGFVIPKPPRKLMPVPTVGEINRLLAQPNVATPCGMRDRALLETAYATGARREELCQLTIFDVDLDNQRLRVLGKGKKERMLPLGKQASQWLRRYILEARPKLLKGNLDEPALWVDLHGKQLGYGALQPLFGHHCRDAGITPAIMPHAVRRACATHMLKNGAHPLQLQLLLGHATLKTLSQYLRLTIAEIQAMHRTSNPGK